MNRYNSEAKEKWGNTSAYKEFENKTANCTDKDFADLTAALNSVFAKFAECKREGNTPDSDKAQTLVKELQTFITQNFYTCSYEILKGLGQMYTADERFRENIDKNGSGTAGYVSDAIKIYTKD